MGRRGEIQTALSLRLKRALRGVTVVVIAGSAVLFGCHEGEKAVAEYKLGGEARSLVASLVQEREGPMSDVLERAGFVIADSSDAPPWFVQELWDPKDCDGVIALEDWSLVRCAWRKSRGVSQDSLRGQLEARGWICASEPQASSVTYIKQEGRCRWVALAYAETEDGASAVMHIQHD